MNAIERRPARLSVWISIAAAVTALGLSGWFSWSALALGATGLVVLLGGLYRRSHTVVSLGAFALLASGILAGLQGAPVIPTLFSITGSVLSWDVGRSAISVGNQLGRVADTRRIEAVHATASCLVGVITVATGYGLFRIGPGEQPIATLLFLVVAALLLVTALR